MLCITFDLGYSVLDERHLETPFLFRIYGRKKGETKITRKNKKRKHCIEFFNCQIKGLKNLNTEEHGPCDMFKRLHAKS